MKYYIISGEASGDLHGGNLIKELKKLDDAADIRCWGGDMMRDAGAVLVKHYKELAFMGFAEVIKNLPTILQNIKLCKKDIVSYKPDVLILIDYPGFNLRIAQWAKLQGLKVVYYIAPQVWAWKENRVKAMKLCIDKMLCILPFEKDYFKDRWNWEVEYVGHPLVEVVENSIQNKPTESLHAKPIVAILPGSRQQEIIKKLPVMLQVTKSFPDVHFIVAQAPSMDKEFYQTFLSPYPNVSMIQNRTYELLNQSKAAMVTSGTATLETALFGVPEVVCYKASNISYQIGKRLVKIKFISLVNLIMDKLVVKELIQQEMSSDNIAKELNLLLNDEKHITRIKKDYKDLKELLSQGGNASQKAAKSIVDISNS